MGIKEDAFDFLRKCLKISERILGHSHPILADPLEQLGTLYCDIDQHTSSEECFYRCLEIRKRVYNNHPSIADTLFNLAK